MKKFKETIEDLENVMFDFTEGRVYDAMKDLENIISHLKIKEKENEIFSTN